MQVSPSTASFTLVLLVAAPCLGQSEDQKIIGSDTVPFDRFGQSVSVADGKQIKNISLTEGHTDHILNGTT